jgi:hypothetical protein
MFYMHMHENTHHLFSESARVLNWAQSHPGQCAVSWHSLANIHYLSKNGAVEFIRDLLKFCEIPAGGSREMSYALNLGLSDLEDAMQVSAALLFGAQVLVTRNPGDYRKAPIKAMHPRDLKV